MAWRAAADRRGAALGKVAPRRADLGHRTPTGRSCPIRFQNHRAPEDPTVLRTLAVVSVCGRRSVRQARRGGPSHAPLGVSSRDREWNCADLPADLAAGVL